MTIPALRVVREDDAIDECDDDLDVARLPLDSEGQKRLNERWRQVVTERLAAVERQVQRPRYVNRQIPMRETELARARRTTCGLVERMLLALQSDDDDAFATVDALLGALKVEIGKLRAHLRSLGGMHHAHALTCIFDGLTFTTAPLTSEMLTALDDSLRSALKEGVTAVDVARLDWALEDAGFLTTPEVPAVLLDMNNG